MNFNSAFFVLSCAVFVSGASGFYRKDYGRDVNIDHEKKVVCPGYSIETNTYCDCDSDCTGDPQWCSCPEAQDCCNTTEADNVEGFEEHCCYNCMGYCFGTFKDDPNNCVSHAHGCDPKHCAPWCGTSNEVKCIGSSMPPGDDYDCCDVTLECSDVCWFQCCPYFKEQCQELCLAQSGGVRHSQCWGEPAYRYCQCSDETVFHIPGFDCEHPDCPPDGYNVLT